jgi:hypothetical protein
VANPFVINDALHTDGAVTSAVEARNAAANSVAHDAAGPALGIFYEGNQSLLTGTATTSPNMTVQVAPLAWCGSKSGTEGVYLGRSPGTVTVDIAAAPSSNSRIDAVYVMQRDSNAGTSADSVTQGEIGVITGGAGVTPTVPAVPAGAVLIGTVTVAAGVTATTNAGVTIATTCRWTTGQGSPIPVRNATEQAALSPYDGLRAYRLDAHAEKVYNGTSWDRPFADFYRSGGGVVSSGWTVLALPTQVAAEGGMTCVSGTFTAPVAGRYRCTGSVMFPTGSGLTRVGSMINVNGGTAALIYAPTAPVYSSAMCSRTIRLNANDTVSFSSFHDASAAIAVATDTHTTWGQVEWVGP